jgi:AraC-like DNA-binding protein
VTEPTVEYVEALPAEPLRPYVDRYIGYRLAGFPPGVHRGLPSRHMTLAVSIGVDIDVAAQTDPRQAPQSYRCVLGGLQAAPALIAHDGYQEGVAIELTPLGSRALTGRPAAELWDLSVELSDAVGRTGLELWERLQDSLPWERRFGICDLVLSRLAKERAVSAPLRHCWRTLVAAGGGVSVRDLAAEVGWSRQHLARRFRDEFGAGPKVAARILRFERARTMLQSPPLRLPLSEIALACGYFDQAHLNRDFAQLARCTPTEWLADELPFFQDADDPDR